METVVVIVIVLAATLYAAWFLAPSWIRMRVAAALLRLLDRPDVPLPTGLRSRLRAALTARLTRASGCGACAQGKRPPAAARGATRRPR
jgi:hypothetical protein